MSKRIYGKLLFVMLILASTSPYRRALLERLGLPFETCAPEVDETAHPGERPAATAGRLARAKAAAARGLHGTGLAIGADQLCVTGDTVLGKPGDAARARDQLRTLSGQRAEFLTAVAVQDLASGEVCDALARTRVRFRDFDDAAIDRYLACEPAHDCAGGFKSEGLGITLVESIEDDDPTALVGLPLVHLCRLLRSFGVELP